LRSLNLITRRTDAGLLQIENCWLPQEPLGHRAIGSSGHLKKQQNASRRRAGGLLLRACPQMQISGELRLSARRRCSTLARRKIKNRGVPENSGAPATACCGWAFCPGNMKYDLFGSNS